MYYNVPFFGTDVRKIFFNKILFRGQVLYNTGMDIAFTKLFNRVRYMRDMHLDCYLLKMLFKITKILRATIYRLESGYVQNICIFMLSCFTSSCTRELAHLKELIAFCTSECFLLGIICTLFYGSLCIL